MSWINYHQFLLHLWPGNMAWMNQPLGQYGNTRKRSSCAVVDRGLPERGRFWTALVFLNLCQSLPITPWLTFRRWATVLWVCPSCSQPMALPLSWMLSCRRTIFKFQVMMNGKCSAILLLKLACMEWHSCKTRANGAWGVTMGVSRQFVSLVWLSSCFKSMKRKSGLT